jgi:hypothetical protein
MASLKSDDPVLRLKSPGPSPTISARPTVFGSGKALSVSRWTSTTVGRRHFPDQRGGRLRSHRPEPGGLQSPAGRGHRPLYGRARGMGYPVFPANRAWADLVDRIGI